MITLATMFPCLTGLPLVSLVRWPGKPQYSVSRQQIRIPQTDPAGEVPVRFAVPAPAASRPHRVAGRSPCDLAVERPAPGHTLRTKP